MLSELRNLAEVLIPSSVRASVLDYAKHTVQGNKSVVAPVKVPPSVIWKEKEVLVTPSFACLLVPTGWNAY